MAPESLGRLAPQLNHVSSLCRPFRLGIDCKRAQPRLLNRSLMQAMEQEQRRTEWTVLWSLNMQHTPKESSRRKEAKAWVIQKLSKSKIKGQGFKLNMAIFISRALNWIFRNLELYQSKMDQIQLFCKSLRILDNLSKPKNTRQMYKPIVQILRIKRGKDKEVKAQKSH